jgi:hypothetical protein
MYGSERTAAVHADIVGMCLRCVGPLIGSDMKDFTMTREVIREALWMCLAPLA